MSVFCDVYCIYTYRGLMGDGFNILIRSFIYNSISLSRKFMFHFYDILGTPVPDLVYRSNNSSYKTLWIIPLWFW